MKGGKDLCHDPCLDPCDEANDCCCFNLALRSAVVRDAEVVDGYANMLSLVLSWATPIPRCVMARAGVESASDLTFEIYLHCPEPGESGTADVTLTGEQITAGSYSFTREELFGAATPGGVCLADLDLSICLVVRDDGGEVVMKCPACPQGCDTVSGDCTCEMSYTFSICCWNTGCDGPGIDPDNGIKARITITANVTLMGTCPYIEDHRLNITVSQHPNLTAVPGEGIAVEGSVATALPGTSMVTMTASFDVDSGPDSPFIVNVSYATRKVGPFPPYCSIEEFLSIGYCD